jgi:hypothetical protein
MAQPLPQSTKFNMTRDVAGYNGFGVQWPQDGESALLAANTEQHITVPSNYPNWLAVFSYTPGSNIWVDGTTTAVVPTGAFSATTAELNPSARQVTAGQVLSFITSDTGTPQVKVSYFVVAPFGN